MFPPGTLEAFALVLIRTSALVLASPLIGTGSLFAGYRVPLIVFVALALFSAPATVIGTTVVNPTPITFAIYAMREVLIGISLAFVLQAVVVAVRVSSSMVGHEMGFTMSNMVDPASGVSTPLIAHMYEVLFFLALLAVNGHHWMFQALAESFVRAPVGQAQFEAGMAEITLSLLKQLFAAGITFAAPILVLLTLVSTLIGLLSRAVPQLNMMEFGFNLRITMGLFAMLLFAPMLQPAMDGLLVRLLEGLEASLDALEA